MPDRLDERDHEIWSKYIGGWSQARLAAEYDVSQQRISQVLSQVRESIPDTARTDAALLAQERTNALLAAVWPAAMGGDTKAVLACLRVVERIAKMLGTDAVEPVTVSFERHLDEQGQTVVDAVNAALEALGLGEEQRQLAVRAAQAKLLGEPAPEPVPVSVPAVEEPDLMADFRAFAAAEGFDPDDLDDEEDEGDDE
jgi:hypothetical protein